MKKERVALKIIMSLATMVFLYPISVAAQHEDEPLSFKEIRTIIDTYAQAREKQDTVLLKGILTQDIDQLVSSGEWRVGVHASVQGMLRSSTGNPGSRKIIIDKIKLLTPSTAIADARYQIENPDGSVRNMWSTFILVKSKQGWKISAIRNMLPSNM